MIWRETTLGEICQESGGIIQTGPFGSQLHESDYSTTGTPLVMPKDIADGKISITSIARVSDDHVERLARHKLELGDIVYGRRGDIGRQALIREEEVGWLCGTGCLRVRLGEGALNSRFLHYYLRDRDVIGWIAGQAVGATMPNLNTKILQRVPVRFPPLPTQRRIASILSAYDDLIENNTRRIEILEEMARSLYREWFVHFRFPGHEKVKLVDSELGKIPEGWEVKRLGDVVDVNKNTIKSSDAPDEIHYVDIASVSTDSINEYTHMLFAAAPGRARRRIADGDVLWSTVRPNRCSYARVFSPPADPVASTGFAVLSPAVLPTSYLYCATTTAEFVSYLVGRARGATYPAVTGKDFERAQVLLPDSRLLHAFDASAGGFFSLSGTLTQKNRVLRQTRDLLLPKLISGEIDVDSLDLPEAS